MVVGRVYLQFVAEGGEGGYQNITVLFGEGAELLLFVEVVEHVDAVRDLDEVFGIYTDC